MIYFATVEGCKHSSCCLPSYVLQKLLSTLYYVFQRFYMKAEVFTQLKGTHEKIFKATYASSCGELQGHARTSWPPSSAATLPLCPPQRHLGKQITADSLGLLCLPTQVCKLCRNPTTTKVFILFQYLFSQPHAGRQANPSLLCLCWASQVFCCVSDCVACSPVFFPLQTCIIVPLYGFSASVKGFLCLFLQTPKYAFKEYLPCLQSNTLWHDTLPVKSTVTEGGKTSPQIIRILFSPLFFVFKSIHWKRSFDSTVSVVYWSTTKDQNNACHKTQIFILRNVRTCNNWSIPGSTKE